ENDDLRARVDEQGKGAAGAVAPVKADGVDEASIRRDIEAQLRSEYEERLARATQQQEQTQSELAAARDEAKAARQQAEEATRNADQRVAEAK
ncbi:hypothetical protein Q0M30_15740, partial [Staphylococcus aureus]|nr:hypothetical protein [Staphylococcus aureus]